MRRKPLFPPPQDRATGKKKRTKGRQDYTALTVNGRVRLGRRRGYSAGEGTAAPLDAWMDAAEASLSLGVRELACRLNADGKNFDKAAANLARAAQVERSGEALRVPVEAEGRRGARARQDGHLPVDWSAADCRTAAGTARRYFGSDGVQVPLVTQAQKLARRQQAKGQRRRRGKRARPLPARKAGAGRRPKEFKVVAYDDEDQAHRLAAGTRGNHEAAGRLMRREAGRVHRDRADEKVGTVDGAPWIRSQVQAQSLPRDALGLDFSHLSEHAHKARREAYGGEDEAGRRWAGTLLHTVKHAGYAAAWQQLVQWRPGLRRGQRRAAGPLLNSASERREMIRYPAFQAKGWQIGSGPTEATGKTLTARRKGPGRRWDADNAEAVRNLEAPSQSGQWDLSWRSPLPPAA